jgi:glycosyltransferase involved in cell wall biosynthesis
LKKLSIITINYNNALGLRKTIESVISQTSSDFEYILIDGCSTDGSIEVIKEFAAKITCWISEPDNGIYNAMNKGISLARGIYCQFLNSGDWLASSYVTEKMLEDMPDCSILYGNMLKQLPDGKIFYNKQIPTASFLTFYNGALNHSSAYIKRSLFDKYGMYDESLRIVSDWKFYLIAIGLNNEPVVYRNIDVSNFDMRGVSNTNLILAETERYKVLNELLPASIFFDYSHYANSIEHMNRINRYPITHWLVWFIERILFRLEKWETNRKGEHLYF